MKRKLFYIFLITFLPICAIYIPFIFKLKQFFFLTISDPGMFNVYKNWDGPHYVIVAKTFYNLKAISSLLFVPLDPKYYVAHFPLYPILIRLVSLITNHLFFSGLVVNLFFSFLLNIVFFREAAKRSKHPYFLTFLFTVFPGRFLIVRSILSPEPLLIFLIFLSTDWWEKRRYLMAGIMGGLAVATKIQALFLFPAFFASSIESFILKKESWKWSRLWMVILPAVFVLLTVWFAVQTGDWNAFSNAEKANKLFLSFPFSQFNFKGAWAGTGWLEDIVFYFFAMGCLVIGLIHSKERSWFYFSLFYMIFLTCIPQRDITRFSLQLLPYFYLTFEKFFTSRPVRYGLILCLPAIYFYAINFILVNQAPITDWSRLLR